MPDADANAAAQYLPNDNSWASASHQSTMWSLSHRNLQGLAYAVMRPSHVHGLRYSWLAMLKCGKLLRLALDAAGTSVIGDTLSYLKAPVRYRALALLPNGRRILLVTDPAAVTSGPSKPPKVPAVKPVFWGLPTCAAGRSR